MKYTKNDYMNKCKQLGVEYVGFHKKAISGDTMIEYICPEHVEKGIQCTDWGHFRVKKKKCPYCSGRYRNTDDIATLLKDRKISLLSNFNGMESKVACRCDVCNNEWSTTPASLIRQHTGCPKCGLEISKSSRRKTPEEFIEDLNKCNHNIEFIGEYINTHTKAKFKCKICNHEWFGYPANILNKSAGCPKCSSSIPENDMIDILKEFGYDIIRQYKINECRNVFPLRFDGFDVKRNIAFEYNGQQHYTPVNFTGKGKLYSNKEFELIVKRDNIKKEYCKNNNIKLIIVPYWEQKNMKEYLISELNKIGEKIG